MDLRLRPTDGWIYTHARTPLSLVSARHGGGGGGGARGERKKEKRDEEIWERSGEWSGVESPKQEHRRRMCVRAWVRGW